MLTQLKHAGQQLCIVFMSKVSVVYAQSMVQYMKLAEILQTYMFLYVKGSTNTVND